MIEAMKKRKGITPVIAIVLLLMMTVAASGGAWMWIQELQNEFQGQVDIRSDIKLISLTCYNKLGDGQVEAYFKNTGKSQIDLGHVNMYVTDVYNGEMAYSLTRTDMSFQANDVSSTLGLEIVTGSSQDFSNPKQSAAYRITTGNSGAEFETNKVYEIAFEFSNVGDRQITQQCEPGDR